MNKENMRKKLRDKELEKLEKILVEIEKKNC